MFSLKKIGSVIHPRIKGSVILPVLGGVYMHMMWFATDDAVAFFPEIVDIKATVTAEA